MNRTVLELDGLDGLAEMPVVEPVRIICKNPARDLAQPTLAEIRAALRGKGRVRVSGTAAKLFVDVDPGPPEEPLIALDTIVRTDARGLERMLLSVLPHVDEVVLGVDARSADETLAVARAFADTVHVFGAAEIGYTDEQWAANKIHFANARNLGRKLVRAPWTLVVDSDEYVSEAPDLRQFVRDSITGARALATYRPDAAEPTEFGVDVRIGELLQTDRQRLALTRFTWWSESHNQLTIGGQTDTAVPGMTIVHDVSLRTEAERDRRNGQRDAGIDALEADAKKGDLPAMFHWIKHQFRTKRPSELVEIVKDYRLRCEVHGPLAEERALLAFSLAALFHHEGNATEAELWALRSLLDGPRMDAFCLLGDIAEDRGDMDHALTWYEAACAVPTGLNKMRWPGDAELRLNRLAAIRRAVGSAGGAVEPAAGEPEGDGEPDVQRGV